MGKRLLSVLMVCCMLTTIFPLSVFAVDTEADTVVTTTDGEEKSEYTVTFNADGKLTKVTVPAGETVAKPKNPKKGGLFNDFAGWTTSAEGGTAFDFETPVTGDITLYAQWSGVDTTTASIWQGYVESLEDSVDEEKPIEPEANEYHSVVFEINTTDVVEDIPITQQIKSGELAVEPVNYPYRDNYAFMGWYVNATCTVPYDFSNKITADTVLYAKWISITSQTDSDNDGIANEVEKHYNIDPNNSDTDNDGINDYLEIMIFNTNPNKSDTDENGVSDALEDFDEDNLTNIYELQIGTNPLMLDSDFDNLYDGEEIEIYNTNPLLNDTDNDGVNDGREVELGTNPLVTNDMFDSVYSYVSTNDSVTPSVEITLNAEQACSLSIEPYVDEFLFSENIPGYMGMAYDFYVEGEFEKATISFTFDAAGLKENSNPVIYYINESWQTLEPLETRIKGNVASADVTHFSKYILIDRTIHEENFEWIDVWDSNKNYTGAEVILVIDDSGSMYSNDRSNYRLSVAKDLIDKLPKNSKVGVVKFASSWNNLTNGITSDREKAKSYLNTSYFYSNGGTNMYKAINGAFNMFEENDESIMRVMIVLSDGQSGDTNMHWSVIQKALSNNVKIYTVGLGSSTYYFSNYLKPLAVNTTGAFYLASEAEELVEIYNNINQKIDIETDSDDDGIPDYYEDNMLTFTGAYVYMDKYSEDTDGDGLLDGEEVILSYEYNEDKTKVKVTGRFVSDPSVQYSDEDSYDDLTEKEVYNTDPYTRNVVIEDTSLQILKHDKYYYAQNYQDRYDESGVLRASVWIGNNVYGSNHSEKIIYKQALLDFFERINPEIQKIHEESNAYDTAIKISKTISESIKGAADLVYQNASGQLLESSKEFLKNLEMQEANIQKNLIEMRNSASSISDYENKIAEMKKRYYEVLDKSSEIKNNIVTDANGKVSYKVELPSSVTKMGTALKVVNVGINILDWAQPAMESYSGYVKLTSNMDTIISNIYILDSIIASSNNQNLKEAASELRTVAQNNYNAVASQVSQAFEEYTAKGMATAVHALVAKIPVVGFWIELGLGIADLIIPVSKSSKAALNIYGMAIVADCLSSDISVYLNPGKQKDCNNNTIYAMYGFDKAHNSVIRYVNFVSMRIYGEQKMIEMLSLGGKILQTLKKLTGTDSSVIIKDCNDIIYLIDSYKMMYVNKY